jgi:hypothetical protein
VGKIREYLPRKVKPKGGKRTPKSTERKSRGADRLAGLISRGVFGCRLARPDVEPSFVERRRTEESNQFNALSRYEQRKAIMEKIRALDKEKASICAVCHNEPEMKRLEMKARLLLPTIEVQIQELYERLESLY